MSSPPPDIPPQSTVLLESDDPLTYLPEPPEEPLPTDCCGTGCSPCVMDIYHDELEMWTRLKSMTPKERADWRRQLLVPSEKDSGLKYALSMLEYGRLKVLKVRKETIDSFVFTFALPNDCCLGYQTGQHCVLRGVDSSGCYVTRQYTPISPPNQTGSFEVLIKIYKEGCMSQIVQQWVEGSMAEWKGPFGGLNYKPNKYKHIGMLACGTGIAPMIQIVRTIVEDDSENTFLHLLYASQDQHSIMLKKELDVFSSYWNCNVLYVLSRTTEKAVKDEPGLLKYGDRIHYGKVDSELVKCEMPPATSDSFVLICGTRSFDKDMINYLNKNGFSKDFYHKF